MSTKIINNKNVSDETRAMIKTKKAIKEAKTTKRVTTKDLLVAAVNGGRAFAPANPNDDSSIMEEGRKQFDTQAVWLEKHPAIYEKVFLKVINTLASQKAEEIVVQACVIKNLPGLTEQQSKFASAQAIYNLSVAGVLTMKLVASADKRKYHKVGLGNRLPDVGMEARRVQKKVAKQAKRLVLQEPSLKVGRNNKHGLYDFKKEDAEYAAKAVRRIQNTAMRLHLPAGITAEYIAEVIFKQPEFDAFGNKNLIRDEIIAEIKEHAGKTFYVEKTLDRIERMYGMKWLDISAPSAFRPYLRFTRKRRITKAGLVAYKNYLEEERSDLPEWFIEELEGLKVGDYTNIMVEVDANNQGPAIVAMAMKDKKWFNIYWGSEDAPKMYEVFLKNLMKNLSLPVDTLEIKDVKYKIMTKPYNKSDESNVFGDKKFLEELETNSLAGLYLAEQEFYQLPLKTQLEMKLGDDYDFEDGELLAAYKKAVLETAPFLVAFADAVNYVQKNLAVLPSTFRWTNIHGDTVYSARSYTREEELTYFDVNGRKHKFTYNSTTLYEDNKYGGLTALSPTWVASVDAAFVHYFGNTFEFDIVFNHDAFFVHGNDVETVKEEYRLFAADKIMGHADAWFTGIQKDYLYKGKIMTFAEMTGIKPENQLTREDILNSRNLVG